MAQLAIYLDDALARRLDEAAKRDGMSRSAWARKALERRLNRGLPESFFEAIGSWEDVALHYARIKQDLASRGQRVGPMELLIAATARSAGATLITGNTREFSRVSGLDVENWIR